MRVACMTTYCNAERDTRLQVQSLRKGGLMFTLFMMRKVRSIPVRLTGTLSDECSARQRGALSSGMSP